MKLAEEVNEMGRYVGIDASSEEDWMVSAYNYCSCDAVYRGGGAPTGGNAPSAGIS